MTIGWDIGGAHLKAVKLNTFGQIVQVMQVLQLPCQLWKGLAQLETAINHMLQAFKIAPAVAVHAVTMTGELVDCFENRQRGVIEISNLVAKLLGKETLFYAANAGFVTLVDVSANIQRIASTNWHASASALAMHVGDALFVDIGSTTTDIIAISGGKVANESLTDASRMADDSLVYTGVVRTPVMALGQKLFFEGAQINVAAEYFATMADVYRLTGELLPENDMAETADGKGKTTLESARRLARMIGMDVENKPIETWLNFAKTCKTVQMHQIKSAVLKHLKPNMMMIGAGAGSFLAKQIAQDLNCKFILPATRMDIGLQADANVNSKVLETCFTAYAVAILAKNNA